MAAVVVKPSDARVITEWGTYRIEFNSFGQVLRVSRLAAQKITRWTTVWSAHTGVRQSGDVVEAIAFARDSLTRARAA